MRESMKFESLVKPAVLTQPVYEPGKPIEYVARELGLDPATIIKLASNENPFGPSPKAVAAAKRALEHGELYPDGGCYELREKLAKARGLDADQFVIGNGSNEIIELVGHALLGPGDDRLSSTKLVLDFMARKISAVPTGGVSFVDARDAAKTFRVAMKKGRHGERYLLGAANWSFAKFFGSGSNARICPAKSGRFS